MGFGSAGWGSGAWGSTILTPLPPGFGSSDMLVSPASGTYLGGSRVLVTSDDANMATCIPDLTDGALDPGFWIDTSVSGITSEDGALAALRLDTTSTGSRRAGLRTTKSETHTDIETTARVEISTPKTGVDMLLYRLALTAPVPGTELALELRKAGRYSKVWLLNTQNSAIIEERPLGDHAGDSVTFRILRSANQVYVFVGGTLRAQTSWFTDLAHIEVACENDDVADSRVRALVTDYTRRPVMKFGDRLMVDVQVQASNRQVIGSTPAQQLPGLQDVTIIGCDGSSNTLTDGFEFTNPNLAIVGNDGSGTLRIARNTLLRGNI